MSIDQRLCDLGIALPQPAAPVAAYVPAVEQGGLLHISGQISFAEDGSLIKGRLGEDVDLDGGAAAARRCGVMLLAQINARKSAGQTGPYALTLGQVVAVVGTAAATYAGGPSAGVAAANALAPR